MAERLINEFTVNRPIEEALAVCPGVSGCASWVRKLRIDQNGELQPGGEFVVATSK